MATVTITVKRGVRAVVPVSLRYSVKGQTIRSQIRAGRNRSAPLIAEWDVRFVNDGSDGKIQLEMDDSVTIAIPNTVGYMDIVRIESGEPYPVVDDIIEVVFRDTITE